MNSPIVGRGEVYEDSAAVILARISDAAGATISQATVSAVNYEVWQKNGTAAVITTTALTVNTVCYTALQTNATMWTVDDTGYNFKHTLGTNILTTANTQYVIQYNFTMVSGDVFPVQFELTTRKVY